MAQTVQGKIARVSSKPFNDQRTGEPITLYSFQLEGANTWYRTGQAPIPAGQGEFIKFVANGANVEKGTLQTTAPVVQQAPALTSTPAHAVASSPTPATTGRTSAGTAGNKDGYWEAKEKRDLEKDARFQAVNEPRMALSVATEAAALLVSTAITKDAISFGNATKAKKLGMLAAYTKEVALDLASFISNAPAHLAEFKSGASPDANEPDTTGEVQE
jgi:hypothetical protein